MTLHLSYCSGCFFGCLCEKNVMSCDGTLLQNVPTIPDGIDSLLLDHTSIKMLNIFPKNYYQLKMLNIERSSLFNIEKGTFSSLHRLRNLSLMKNELPNLHKDIFGVKSSLTHLNIAKNKFKLMPVEAICQLRSLILLDLHTNPQMANITFSDKCFLNLRSMSTINLSDNDLNKSTTCYDMFKSLSRSSITTLQLSNCKIYYPHYLLFKYTTTLKYLYLDSNPISILPRDLFRHLPRLEVLQITKTHLKDVSFNSLPQSLRYLSIGGAGLDLRHIDTTGVSNFQNLSVLSIQHLNKSKISYHTFKFFENNTNITDLYIYEVEIDTIEPYSFQHFSSLKRITIRDNTNLKSDMIAFVFYNISEYVEYISIRGNHIGTLNVNTFARMKDPNNVIELDLSDNELDGYIPIETLNKFTNIQSINLHKNYIHGINSSIFLIFDHLHYLNLSDNAFKYLTPNLFCTFPFLKILDLSYNNFNYFLVPTFNRCTQHLETLKLVSTNIKSLYKFEVFPNLIELDLNGNELSEIRNSLFWGLSKLQTLKMSTTYIKTLPEDIFRDTTQLEVLEFTNNELDSLELVLFSSLTKLKRLSIAYNQLTLLNITMLYNLPSLEKLYMEHLPLICSCELYKFITIVREKNIYIKNIYHPLQTQCNMHSIGKDISFLDFHMSSYECRHLSVVITLTVCYICVCILFILLTLGYRFRWYIRYEYFLLRTNVFRYREAQNNDRYLFDAFVSFSQKDCEWVMSHLIREVEHINHMKICLYNRNWLGGNPIVEYIIQSIENSKRIIFVVTNHWLKSNWCKDELHLARYVYTNNVCKYQ